MTFDVGSQKLSDFDYDLPPDLVAQEPSVERDQSRLLVVDRANGKLTDSRFSQLTAFLRPGDLVVGNESRVIPARVEGVLETGSEVELLLIAPTKDGAWDVMGRPARKLRIGTSVEFPGGVTATVTALGAYGRRVVRLDGTPNVNAWLETAGRLPIPPYIKRYPEDAERYQTVYSQTKGSIAAPTAGLHFTPTVLAAMRAKGVDVRFVTLHVGPGTFKTIREENLADIRLEPERGSISAETALAVRSAKLDGRRVVAVGTTTTRLLEGLRRTQGMEAWQGAVDLFIHPPFEFRVVDALITNFHLPKSTLLMLVSSFAGTDLIKRAYAHAVAEQYRFYSFGDAMFIQ